MKIFTKKRILLFITGIGLFIIFSALLNSPNDSNNQESEIISDQTPEYNNLKLGYSKKEDVLNELGNPINTRLKANQEVLEYESNNPNFNNEVYLQENKIYFIREVVTAEDNKTIFEITNSYGRPTKVLYGPRSGVGFYLYVYPEKGIAYIGHDKSGILLEIWYFTPTTYEYFKFNYAKDYSETKTVIQ